MNNKVSQNVFVKEDGTLRSVEECIEFVNSLPMCETFEQIVPININNIEEFIEENGGVMWDDVKNKYFSQNANKPISNK